MDRSQYLNTTDVVMATVGFIPTTLAIICLLIDILAILAFLLLLLVQTRLLQLPTITNHYDDCSCHF